MLSAVAFYKGLQQSTTLAKEEDSVLTLTFGFQQNLPLPHIPVGDMFYMQQLWMYVFSVYSCSNNHVTMYCWPEHVAKRAVTKLYLACTIFCLVLVKVFRHFHFFLIDALGKIRTAMSCIIFSPYTGKITHTFPMRGHSYLPNDRDLGRTELKKRKQEQIYTCE